MKARALDLERVRLVYSCRGDMVSVFLDLVTMEYEQQFMYVRDCPGCKSDHNISLAGLERYVHDSRDDTRIQAQQKADLEKKLAAWGAEADTKVSDCWWLNGHCFKIMFKNNEYILEEL